jgi:hypothetical protein
VERVTYRHKLEGTPYLDVLGPLGEPTDVIRASAGRKFLGVSDRLVLWSMATTSAKRGQPDRR